MLTISKAPSLDVNNAVESAYNAFTVGDRNVAIGSRAMGNSATASDATEKNGDKNDVLVFPNPIREGYNGYISINGLSHNSEVKITDISGNLVFQTRTNGSTAVWNGKDVNGEKIATGVYLIFNSSISGEEENVGKMLFIK